MDKNEEISQWIECGAPYDEGVALFARHARNKTLLRVLPGRSSRYADKLEYELRKLAGLPQPVKKLVPSSLPAPDPHSFHFAELEEGLPGKEDEEAGETPESIQKLRDEFTRCYNQRSILHKELRQIEGGNSAKIVARRKILVDQIRGLSLRLDELLPVYEAWKYEGTVPEGEIQPMNFALQEDPKELKKKIDNLKKTISKDKLFLEYQAVKKLASPNPLPHGPRRHELEERIKAKQVEMDELKSRLNGLTQD